ncbi:heavy metal-binding domain-containing protein [Neolewinella antarctica]|uniref:Nucleic acid binding AN1-type Zn finger protein n=1 Tax=Neolewinella antarctica TaxID=442734 RepID=A0ABX0XA81_9BACT|nr:heavy metal-binding domain-containing protein [Neolewinella antarctica]NJC25844.1 putative nucleic acid binding AN1-type Zn finger protein [Neolewinella antarctica]
MYFIKSMASLILVLCLTFAFTACGDAATTTDAATETTIVTPHGEGKEFTSAYVCPMHCADSGSDAPGKCPVCGMTYVAQEEHTGNDHKH